MRRVLVLEANDKLRGDLLLGLRRHAIEAEGFSDLDEMGAALVLGTTDVIVVGAGACDVRDLVVATGASPSPIEIVVLVRGGIEPGLQAMRAGAIDFVGVEQGIEAVAQALSKIDARRAFLSDDARALPRTAGPRPRGAAGSPSTVMVGANAKIVALMTMVRRLAGVRAAILIGGESGTGKELIAQALHNESPWRAGAFVAVNCGAIPAGLIESELFGHVRGAFTDAVRDKRGLFEAAHGGTLFLDEIADLPLGLQSKLLRAVQDGVVRRVGDVSDLRVETRVVAATARDLAGEVKAGRFREDLYYRLAGLLIQIPPLRDRRDDIPLLATHFLARGRARLGLTVNDIEPEAMQALVAYGWPGNVRELENTIERAAVLCVGNRIDLASLPERLLSASPANTIAAPVIERKPDAADAADLSIKRASRRAEENLIKRALVATGGNRTRAAELLEISHRALLYKIKEYGIVVVRGKRDLAELD
jgi:two-component system response regulator AtoC